MHGYAVVPTPRQVELNGGEILFDGSWQLKFDRVNQNDIAVQFLLKDLEDFYYIKLSEEGKGEGIILLSIESGAVETNAEPDINKRAYRLVIKPKQISVTGNDRAGLFYGVQTLLQLLKPNEGSGFVLPVCTITDWPSLQLRTMHWNVEHHHDRIETCKRYLDWSVRFKINGIVWEIEDKFAWPSHPIIGAPGAFTSEQVQEIVDYGLERHIQVIPMIESPGHMGYVLKHPEFAHLRCDGSNYQICTLDERSYELIFSMYEDIISATQGVKYFYVSMNEFYYPGICEKGGKPYNLVNRSLYWVEFVNRAHEFLTTHDRRMMCKVSYPLLTEHVKLLPSDLIDVSHSEYVEEEMKLGIRKLARSETQGGKRLFPNLLPYVSDGSPSTGRLQAIYECMTFEAWKGNPFGSFIAAWDDSGLHNETFWLGWATGAQYAWTPGIPEVEQSVSEFIRIYYGPHVSDMVEIYRGLQKGARFWENAWDRIPSRERPRAYGNSRGKGIGGERSDHTLTVPDLSQLLPDLSYQAVYRDKYAELLANAKVMIKENNQLIYKIQENIDKATRNRYNLEVFLALAEFQRHQIELILDLERIDGYLTQASLNAKDGVYERAVALLLQA